MRIVITGANGFVGGWLVRALLEGGHQVVGGAGSEAGQSVLTAEERARVTWVPLDLDDAASIDVLLDRELDAVVHLAAAASVAESLRGPERTWRVNVIGTVRLLDRLAAHRQERRTDPRLLVVSTGEVYGRGDGRPRTETDPIAPLSPYAASKAAAEIAAFETWRRTGLDVVVARPFPHTGPGQSTRFVVPAFVERLRLAARARAPVVKTGNLEPVRDLLDVRDVVAAYLALLIAGTPGAVYNVASGRGVSMGAVLTRIAELLDHRVIPEPDPVLVRAVDIPHLVGDAGKLRAASGWTPRWALDDTLQLMLDAETD